MLLTFTLSWDSAGERESLVPLRGVYSLPPVSSCRFKARSKSGGRKSFVIGFVSALGRVPEDSMIGRRQLFLLVFSSLFVRSVEPFEEEKTSRASDVGGGAGGSSRVSDNAELVMSQQIYVF